MTEQVQRERSALGTTALIGTALSALGLVVSLLGNLLGVDGFDENTTDNAAAADLAWLAFSLGGLIALVTGVLAWVLGARRDRAGDVRAGQIAIGYLVAAVVITFLFDVLTD